MYVMIDDRDVVRSGYTAGFSREGLAALAFGGSEFWEWLNSATDSDLAAVEGFLLGEVSDRTTMPSAIRGRTRAPIIALDEQRSLEQTIELFAAGVDDAVKKPVHLRELVARCNAIWRRAHSVDESMMLGRLQVFFDGRDPLVDNNPIMLPRRERQILEYLVKNKKRRISKTQLFNAIYGVFNEVVDETVIEGHISKLRKKLREQLGEEVIEAKRFAGYCFVGPTDPEEAQAAPRRAGRGERPQLRLVSGSPASL